MENYEIIKPLSAGSQGSVYQVQHKETKKVYVLKKIQCLNEKKANLALDEAKALMLLDHPNICTLRDHFIKWDAQMNMFEVCIVMDCYTDGTLSGILYLKRKSKENIDEILVKKWLAQFVLSLAHIHEKKFIHRDLKPDNIFISSSLDLILGDFGVVAFENDVRRLSHSTAGTPMWMAPEQLDGKNFDERCDVWSFGCILCEILTCRHFSDSQIGESLVALRKNDNALKQLSALISKDYSQQMADFVQLLLRRDYQKRPFSRDLKKHPLVKECCKLLPGTSQENSSAPPEPLHFHPQCSKTSSVELPSSRGPTAVFAFLQQHLQEEEAAESSLEWLAAQDDFKVDQTTEKVLGEALRIYSKSPTVCAAAARICATASRRVAKSSSLLTSAIVRPMLEAAKMHSTILEVQLPVARYQHNISDYEGGPRLLGAHAAVDILLAALRNFAADPQLTTVACAALRGLFSDEENAENGVKAGALEVLSRSWITHKGRPAVLAVVAGALLGLSGEEAILPAAEQFQLVSHILSALSDFPVNKDLIRNSLQLLASFAEDERLAISFLTAKNVPDGISLLSRLLSKHQNVTDVIEPMSEVLANVLSHKPKLAQKQTAEIRGLAKAILKQFSGSQSIKRACEDVLQRIDRQ